MIKKIFGYTIFTLLLLGVAAWSPWESWDLSFFTLLGIEEQTEYAGLEVYSLKDEFDVYIDGISVGSVSPEFGSLSVPQIEPGSHIVTLRSDKENFFEFTRPIDFHRGLSVVVAYELGPSKVFSQGHVFYALGETVDEGGMATLTINTAQSDVSVLLDGAELGQSPINELELDLSKNYTIVLKKEGYEELEFNILPETQEERDQLSGLDLFIDASLFLIPFDIE
ncbi:PEGA domain-containing protein [Candidatus Dojkabacteria bacterium]|uniref:PEGA domain-containing protein n=1 Tax=Candidatus Dojkabacteria bacterium TaxID=2099670 RepID=A0A955L8U8_9BACT|nr:PEGA domain-containing protein [Candidatus Dojkabacteria bacterium]